MDRLLFSSRRIGGTEFVARSAWDRSDIVQAIQRSDDRLDPDVQAELPLERVWTLVHEGDEDEE